MTTQALDRLAALAGIEEGWWDFFGTYRKVPQETKLAFLSAMGFAVASDAEIEDSLARFEEKPWLRCLEPVTVAPEQNGAPVISITVPDDRERSPLSWSVREEIGATHQGSFIPRDLPMPAERTIGTTHYRRHLFTLPGTPLSGIHRLTLRAEDGWEVSSTLIVTPAKAYVPPELQGGDKPGLWGLATQLYALRSDSGWGVGDFSDLAELGSRAAVLGASAVGINPLHALFPTQPERFSPYSPSGRRFLNVFYIDVEAVPDFRESREAKRFFASPGFQARLAAAQNARLVDYPNVGSLKFTLLEFCWKSFRANHLGDEPSERGQAFRAFQAAGGAGAERFATFEALQEQFLRDSPNKGYWRTWPTDLQNPHSDAVAAFRADNQDRVQFFWYLQWLADEQLKSAQAACRDSGMALGVYRDMGVGIADDGGEAWANQDQLCLGVSVGAPPDPLNLAGQDWGLAPFNPLSLREHAYQSFIEVLEANMTHAGAMRLDHAMSLQRLYWVPRGAKADQGAYVRYPVEDLFGLVALASCRKKCLIIGEDLGTVPDGFRERMDAMDILGYRLMVFEKTGDGRFKQPEELDRKALVGIGTHDLPSLGGWWRGIDIDERIRLKIYPDPAMGQQELDGRAADRAALVQALTGRGLLEADFPTGPELDEAQLNKLSAAVHAYLRQSGAWLRMVQFEDVLGQVLQMNLPGTTIEHPNWRVRYPATLADMFADPRMAALR